MKKIPTKRKIDARSRVVLPKEVMKRLKAKNGDEIEFKEEERKIYISVWKQQKEDWMN